MSQQAILDFRTKLESSEKLKDALRAEMAKGEKADIAALGRSQGFDFTAAEFKEFSKTAGDRELTPFEMEMVAGGAMASRYK